MDLTQSAQAKADYYTKQFFGGMISASKFLKLIGEIYYQDRLKQEEFYIELGYSPSGAIRHIFKLDEGEEIL